MILDVFLVGEQEEPDAAIIAVLTTLVMVLLFSPVKGRIQDVIDRLFFREGYNSRKALLHLSQELNTELDLARTAERCFFRRNAVKGQPLSFCCPYLVFEIYQLNAYKRLRSLMH